MLIVVTLKKSNYNLSTCIISIEVRTPHYINASFQLTSRPPKIGLTPLENIFLPNPFITQSTAFKK